MKNNRNIILMDRDIKLCQYILDHTNWTVQCLVVENNEISLFENNSRIKSIIPYDDLLYVQDTNNININLLEAMRDIQLDCETTLHRCMHDNILAKYIYYSHLSFFSEIFQKNTIDFVLCSETNLGVPGIVIPLGLARNHKIPAYTIDPDLSFSLIYRYNEERFIDTQTISPVNLKNKAYVPYEPDKIGWELSFKKIIKNILQKLGGQLLAEFFVCLAHLDFKHYTRLGIHVNYWDKLRSYRNFKQAISFYNKNAITPNLRKKFIYFSLHVEPEAVILARVGLDNQLLLIKMLSNAIPKDWVIYVKEHPHQLKINNPEGSYFINNIDYYKNISFYKELVKIPNVQLVNLDVHPKDLTIHAQAVASIGGSISTEAWLLKVPAINFCPKQAFGALLSNSMGIESYSDVKQAISTLCHSRDAFIKQIDIEKDQKKIQGYMLPQDTSAFPIILDTILRDIEENPCR